jgi:hypothetical protein
MSAEIIVASMIPMVVKALKPLIEEWLDAGKSPASNNIAPKLSSKKSLPYLFDDLVDANAAENITNGHDARLAVATAVAAAALPVKNTNGKKLQLKVPHRRWALAATWKDGVQGVAILAESASGVESEAVRELSKTFPGRVDMLFVGKAQSGGSSEAVKPPNVPGLAPGSSICHHNGWAGTLGVFVRPPAQPGSKTDRTPPAFTGASHVLDQRGLQERRVYSPGRPDREPTLASCVGELTDLCGLVDYQDREARGNVINLHDIGIVRIIDDCRDCVNVVKDADGTAPLYLKGVLSEDEIYDRFSEGMELFMVGRTTRFSRGMLCAVDATPYPVQIDAKRYLYGDFGFVRSINDRLAFSSPGDSGAPVYTSDGWLVGFVVGASPQGTMIHMAHACLDAMNAELIHAK